MNVIHIYIVTSSYVCWMIQAKKKWFFFRNGWLSILSKFTLMLSFKSNSKPYKANERIHNIQSVIRLPRLQINFWNEHSTHHTFYMYVCTHDSTHKTLVLGIKFFVFSITSNALNFQTLAFVFFVLGRYPHSKGDGPNLNGY